MKNRFVTKRKHSHLLLSEFLMPAIFFASVIVLFYYGLAGIGDTADTEKLRAAEQAVTRAAVQCYAVEGRYPPDIAYLYDRYGLSVDEERYVVHYKAIADNLVPEVVVLPRYFSQDTGEVPQL